MTGPCARVWRTTGALAVLALTGCTGPQIEAWVSWHDHDPAAAEAFADLPEVQQALQVRPPAVPHAATWDRIARCESGGRWNYPPVTNRTGTYSGGLMIWTKAWIIYGGQQYAPQAWLATRAEQIDVAERILADRGWRAWDCA